jgi:hypothetical protein
MKAVKFLGKKLRQVRLRFDYQNPWPFHQLGISWSILYQSPVSATRGGFPDAAQV